MGPKKRKRGSDEDGREELPKKQRVAAYVMAAETEEEYWERMNGNMPWERMCMVSRI